MSNLNKVKGWTGDSEYVSRTSAQSYLASGSAKMNSSSCGSSCGSKDDKPKPSSCGAGDSEPKPSACGAGDGDSKPKTSSCGS